MAELTTFLTENTEHFARLEKGAALAEWEVATTGIEEANRRVADT
jgi:hypothetical protein